MELTIRSSIVIFMALSEWTVFRAIFEGLQSLRQRVRAPRVKSWLEAGCTSGAGTLTHTPACAHNYSYALTAVASWLDLVLSRTFEIGVLGIPIVRRDTQ